MAHRVAGVLRMNPALLEDENLATAASTISALPENETAQLWQLNAFVKGEQQHLSGQSGVFHARKTKGKTVDGTEVEEISLYIRPKAHWLLARFDNWIYGEEQRLASDVLAPLVKRGARAVHQSGGTSPLMFRTGSDTPEALATGLEAASIAPVLQCIADAITAVRLDTPDNPAPARRDSLRNAVRAEQEFTQWNANADTETLAGIETRLLLGEFLAEEIAAFHAIFNDIAQRRDTGNVDMDALHRFWMKWVARCERTDRVDINFRELICGSKRFRAWNVLAYHLARQPKFDLRSHADYSRVMVPDVTAMVWPELLPDHGATHAMVRTLHARAREKGISAFEPTFDGERQLYAANTVFLGPRQHALRPPDETYLSHTYNKFLKASIDAGEPCLLIPLFNYTRDTVAACVSIMLEPVRQALEKGQSLPKIGMLSTDPRISEQFDDELTRLKMEAQQKERRTVPAAAAAMRAMTQASAPSCADGAIPATQRAQKLRLNVGITEEQWRPQEKTLLVLTDSARGCISSSEPVIDVECGFILESEGYSSAKQGQAIFRFKNEAAVSYTNRYMVPVEEVSVEGGLWPLGSGNLDDAKASEIQLIYHTVCKTALAAGLDRLILTPCFALPRNSMFGNDKPYKDALGITVRTLNAISGMYPGLDLTLIARSDQERVLMEAACLDL